MMRAFKGAETHSQVGQPSLREEGDRLYEQYGKPLEAEHYGRFVAVSRDGRTILGDSVLEVGRAARESFGPETFVFKIGPRAVGRWL